MVDNTRLFITQKSVFYFYFFVILLLTFMSSQSVFAGQTQIIVAWNPNNETNLAGYRIYYGTNPSPKSYGTPISLEYTGNEPKFTISGLTSGQRYYIVVTAFDQSNKESGPSNEVSGFPSDHYINLVTKYYNDILERAPEPGGAEGWTTEIERIVSLGIDIIEGYIALARLFFNSNEYVMLRKSDSQYITDLYQTFLNRTPTLSEINYWLGFITQGLTRDALLSCFAYSEECKLYLYGIFGVSAVSPENNLVNDFYRGFLNRLPDNEGFNNYLTQMRNAQCAGAQQVKNLSRQIALGFVQCAEYTLRNRNNSQYVEDLYNGILRRGPDPAGFAFWINLLNNRTYTREQLLDFFVSSAEFQIRVQEVIVAGCVQ